MPKLMYMIMNWVPDDDKADGEAYVFLIYAYILSIALH